MRLVVLILFIFCLSTATAQETGKNYSLTADINIYPYIANFKNDTDLSIIVNGTYQEKFSYLSFNNFGDVVSTDNIDFLFSEHTLRWQPSSSLPIDLVAQVTIIPDNRHDRIQAGARVRLHETGLLKRFYQSINAIHTINFFVKRWSGDNDEIWQMEHFYLVRFPYLSDRLYLSGWIDHTFAGNPIPGVPKNPLIGEAQLGFRLFSDVYATAEYRFNEFRREGVHDLGIGIEFKTRW